LKIFNIKFPHHFRVHVQERSADHGVLEGLKIINYIFKN